MHFFLCQGVICLSLRDSAMRLRPVNNRCLLWYIYTFVYLMWYYSMQMWNGFFREGVFLRSPTLKHLHYLSDRSYIRSHWAPKTVRRQQWVDKSSLSTAMICANYLSKSLYYFYAFLFLLTPNPKNSANRDTLSYSHVFEILQVADMYCSHDFCDIPPPWHGLCAITTWMGTYFPFFHPLTSTTV